MTNKFYVPVKERKGKTNKEGGSPCSVRGHSKNNQTAFIPDCTLLARYTTIIHAQKISL